MRRVARRVRWLGGLLPFYLRQGVKIKRAELFEFFGSGRFSHPALNDLDLKLSRCISSEPGVFLEIGANNGYTQSNTYYFARALGWRGILIEPVPRLYEQCCRLRPESQCFNVACVGPDHFPTTVELINRDLMSSTLLDQVPVAQGHPARKSIRRSDRLKAAAMTISTVIDRSGESEIDLLSLDVEGSELQVLAGLDFDRHAPKWLLVETHQIDAVIQICSPWMELVDQMSHHDYLLRRL